MGDVMSETINLQSNTPQVNPDVQRAVQHLMQGVSEGKIIGVAFIGITATGEVVNGHALPGTPGVLYMAVGALQGMITDLLAFVMQLRQQQKVSRILVPTTNVMRPNG